MDSSGNLYVTGYTPFYGTEGDIFVAKLSPAGTLISFGAASAASGSGSDSGFSVGA